MNIYLLYSFAPWESAQATCNDLNSTLPVLDTMEDMKVFGNETGYMTIVYLGATSNQKPNSCEYIWIDKSSFHFLTNIATPIGPGVDIYTAGVVHVKRITFPYTLIYHPQVMSLRIVSMPCDTQLNVSLYCSTMVKQGTQVYNTTMSTIRIGFAENNFRTIGKGRYCSNNSIHVYGDPLWWFQQHDICLRLHHCYFLKSCEVLNEVCKPHKLYLFPYNDAHSSIFNKKSHIAKFLSIFQDKHNSNEIYFNDELLRLHHTIYIPMFNSNASNVIQSLSKFTGVFLSVTARNIDHGLWAHQGTVEIFPSNQTKYRTTINNFVFCTKDTLPAEKLTCSSTYFQCNDGTCIDEHLVCDGRQHCMMEEDEKKCTNICTDKVSCALNCSYMNTCFCLRGYFQCESGGCIPVGKLCDRVYNCKDGSDEPMSCEFDSAQLQRIKVEEQWNIGRQRCSQGTESNVFLESPFHLYPLKLTYYSTDSYKISWIQHHLGILYFMCFAVDPRDNNLHPRYSLDRWCIYNYSWFADIGYAHVPCGNGYHLSSCENMYCIDTFKCMRSYCLEWKYVCDNKCDCPQCEDESICENISCPGMILHESAHGKVYCNEQADSRLAAVLIQSSSYDMYIHAQSEMCAQVLNCKDNITTWNNIVYLDLLYGDHLGDNLHVTVEMMEFLIYCNITHCNLGEGDAKYIKNLVVVQYLDLSQNNIGDNFSNLFARMTQLLCLDLSSNHFTYLKGSLLCVSSNLKYFFIQNNKISHIEYNLLYFTTKLSILYLQGNALLSRSVDSELFQMQSRLSTLSSDLPRLCCMVSTGTQCSPEFTLFVSCSDMIHSKFHKLLAWIIGILTSVCNVTCIFMLIVTVCVQRYTNRQKKIQPLLVIMSFNINFADMVVSVCILSLSVYNIYYQGVFGIYADIWRQTIACYSLELSILVGNKCSLIFSVYLAAVFYIQITSLVKKTPSMKKNLATVILV